MYRLGEEEAKAVAQAIEEGKLFRYQEQSCCERFEQRWVEYIGVPHAMLTASGTSALVAALMGLGIGPGDEVLVPAHTYMASASAVVAVGAIPVVVDVDHTTTLSPEAMEDAVGPHTRAVIPVHMWGLACDMSRIMEIARRRGLLVVEDCCQAVGGGFEGQMLGSFGDCGAYSFNYFKNISCGEGGCVVARDPAVFARIASSIDACRFYFQDVPAEARGFISNSARASEFEGAILNVQLDRLPEMLQTMRAQKKRILSETADVAPVAPYHSPEHECGSQNLFQFDSPARAKAFAEEVGGQVLRDTGRHVYTEWAPILEHRGAHHPALNPFDMPQNRSCRMDYRLDMCQPSLGILARTVKVGNHPDRSDSEVAQLIERIRAAATDVQAAPSAG